MLEFFSFTKTCEEKKNREYTFQNLSVCPSVHLSVCPSVHLSICPFVHLSIYPFVRLSVCLKTEFLPVLSLRASARQPPSSMTVAILQLTNSMLYWILVSEYSSIASTVLLLPWCILFLFLGSHLTKSNSIDDKAVFQWQRQQSGLFGGWAEDSEASSSTYPYLQGWNPNLVSTTKFPRLLKQLTNDEKLQPQQQH